MDGFSGRSGPLSISLSPPKQAMTAHNKASIEFLLCDSDTEAPSRSHSSSTSSSDDETRHLKRASHRVCTMEGCTKVAINRGRCFTHGVQSGLLFVLSNHEAAGSRSCLYAQGGKRCAQADCEASAKHFGLCWKHGGSIQCKVDGCERRGKTRGLCWSHGGGTTCQTNDCETIAVSNGHCWAHGGGKRCQLDGCQRAACTRTADLCRHHYELQNDQHTG